MTHKKTLSALLVGAALGSIAIPAQAQSAALETDVLPKTDTVSPERDASADTDTSVPEADVNVRGYAMAFSSTQAGGVAAGGMALARFGMFEVGGFAEKGGAVFDYTYNGIGAAAGLAWRSEGGFRLEGMATAGRHHYEGFDSGLFGGPGASGNLAFVGARVAASYAVISSPLPIEIGLMGVAETDLGRKDVEVTSFSWSGSASKTTKTIGTTSYGAALTLGTSIDL